VSQSLPRRTLLKAVIGASVAIPVASLTRRAEAAAPAPMVDGNDPTAKALGYVPDASKVDAKANPTYKAGQRCGVCVQFQGKATDKQGACNLFAGKQVVSTGWCRVWAQKPA
jgi:High potential iron-sulfur protein